MHHMNDGPVPSITVCNEEVPLNLYWQAVDLWTDGHSNDSIVVHIVATKTVADLHTLRAVVGNIIYNQELIKQSTPSKASNIALPTPSHDMRGNSRIFNVGELDDLHVAQMVADKKKKERLGLKQFLARLA